MSALLEKYLFFVKKFIPEKTPQLLVGLDIGSHTCKLIEITPIKDSFMIVGWAIEPVRSDGAEEAVKRILNRVGIHSRSPYTAVAGHGTLVRFIDMPIMPAADLQKSLAIEADKYFPFPRDQMYTDCRITNIRSKDGKMSVLLAAAKKEIIDQRIQILSHLNLQADCIGLDSLAIANIFNMASKKGSVPGHAAVDAAQSQAVAILNIGDSTSSLVILKDNSPSFMRDIFLAGRDLNKRISNVLGVGFAEAEKIKHQPQDKLEVALSAYDSVFSNLVSEIRLSFDYFLTENNTPISKLFLTGGSSMLEGIESFFAKNLDIAIEKWNPFLSFTLSPGISEDEFYKNANRLGVALGLALYSNG